MYEPTKTLNKVWAGGVAGAAAGMTVTIVVWLLQRYAHVEMPADVIAAVTGLLTLLFSFLAAWVTPLRPGEVRPVNLEPHPVTTPPDDPSQPALIDFERHADDAMPRRPVASGHDARITPDGDEIVPGVPALGPDEEPRV